MKFNLFKSQYQKYPLILSRDIHAHKDDLQKERNQLNRWVKNGLIIRLKRGVYALNQQDRKIDVDVRNVANHLCDPSYVSMEYALTFYGIIPEETKAITSITTRKTMAFENQFGNFVYQHIKPSAFRGFKKMGSPGCGFFMAEPEKALVDFIYLHLAELNKDINKTFENSYRFQSLDELNKERLLELGSLFQNKKLLKALAVLGEMIDEAKND